MSEKETTVTKIHNNETFQELNLQDQEIIRHKSELETILKINELCNNPKGCMCVSTHYIMERDEDNNLKLSDYVCHKKKYIMGLDDETVNQHIEKKLMSEYKFDNSEAKSITYSLLNDKKNGNKWHRNISNILHKDQEIENEFLTLSNRLDRTWIAYAYIMILKNQDVCVIRSNSIKTIVGNYAYNFSTTCKTGDNTIEYKYNYLINVENLIILELGYENDINIVNYFLDFLPELLHIRNQKNLVTLVGTDINAKEIQEHIMQHPKYIKTTVNEKKLSGCFACLAQNVFSHNI